MATINKVVTTEWSKVADLEDKAFLVTWSLPVLVEFATTAADNAPVVQGHSLSRHDALTRMVIGDGYLWARVVPGSRPDNVNLVITK